MRFLVALILIIQCTASDFFSKQYVKSLLSNSESFYITDFLQLVPVWNKGVSFGMLKFFSYKIIVSMTTLLLFYLLYFAFKMRNNNWIFWPVVFIIGGACSNLLDRILFGSVFDFIDFHLGNWHWPAFNIADCFITISAIFLIPYFIFIGYEKKNI